ncbi:hypothetical protein M408DRAFT_29598 [Serendipita vermifera MAFF 305830]|uniref:DUF6570 domain-containing protein n=1 Tax=Serendipita vermifera MAFF 305830 TaxID=933852 RepID=A0A0C3AQ62_SERVB|nr:hypothetical protein M408DRAFT_29598 [Serendipita vermifera MAFF 305830]
MPKYALANWLYYAHDRLPTSVRLAFENSTIFEQSLIARARANRITFRYCHNPTSPQYGWNFQTSQSYSKGNVMILPQDSLSLQSMLPPSPDAVRDTMAVLFIGPTVKPTRENIRDLHPCLVRKSRISCLINFLTNHNPYYASDADFEGLSPQNLDSLAANAPFSFEDGDLFFPAAVEIAHIDSRTYPSELDVTVDYTNRNDAEPLDTRDAQSSDLLLETVG